MAVATMEPQTMVEAGIIKTAMDRIGLKDKVEDLLDEIELQRRLKISAEQADRGETMSLEEMNRELAERKAKNGYYSNRR